MTRPLTVLPLLLLLVLPLAVLPGTRAHAQTTCTKDADCADGDECTINKCSPDLGCFSFHDPACPSCLGDDDCDDGDACTADVCQAGQCLNDPASGPACDDGDACTTGDVCQDGMCTGTPLLCTDGFACTEDACEAGACVFRPDDSACGDAGECATAACRPDDPAANASGCMSDPAPFDGQECSADGEPCSVDRCQTAICGHAPVSEVVQCSPVRPSYSHAVMLRTGVDRLLSFVQNEAPVGGQSGAVVLAELTDLRNMLDASIRALSGLDAGSPPAGPRLKLPANPSIAQLRGTLALVWLRGAPGRASKFMGAVSRGRRQREIDPGTARELRRNGRILLADTKALKRDVKNLQKTFSIFQR